MWLGIYAIFSILWGIENLGHAHYCALVLPDAKYTLPRIRYRSATWLLWPTILLFFTFLPKFTSVWLMNSFPLTPSLH